MVELMDVKKRKPGFVRAGNSDFLQSTLWQLSTDQNSITGGKSMHLSSNPRQYHLPCNVPRKETSPCNVKEHRNVKKHCNAIVL
jgi:hypothetical protein